MKKILIVNWQKWKWIQQNKIPMPEIEPAYPGHTINLVEYDPEIIKFLEKHEIEYKIDNREYVFKKKIKRTFGKLKRIS